MIDILHEYQFQPLPVVLVGIYHSLIIRFFQHFTDLWYIVISASFLFCFISLKGIEEIRFNPCYAQFILRNIKIYLYFIISHQSGGTSKYSSLWSINTHLSLTPSHMKQALGVRDDLFHTVHRTTFLWCHRGPVMSQSTDLIKWPI